MFCDEENVRIFREPKDSQTVMRYLTLGKLFDLIETKSLYFAHPTSFNDPFEGEVGPANHNMRPELYKDTPQLLDQFPSLDRVAKAFTYVSCWTASDQESHLMSASYAAPDPSVIVVSTWGALKRSIESERKVYGGLVDYVDYETYFIPEGNMFYRHIHKRIRYADEREVRLLAPVELNQIPNNSTPVKGVRIPVDLTTLIQQIWVVGDRNGTSMAALKGYLELKGQNSLTLKAV
jgi:hypothetical protein